MFKQKRKQFFLTKVMSAFTFFLFGIISERYLFINEFGSSKDELKGIGNNTITIADDEINSSRKKRKKEKDAENNSTDTSTRILFSNISITNENMNQTMTTTSTINRRENIELVGGDNTLDVPVKLLSTLSSFPPSAVLIVESPATTSIIRSRNCNVVLCQDLSDKNRKNGFIDTVIGFKEETLSEELKKFDDVNVETMEKCIRHPEEMWKIPEAATLGKQKNSFKAEDLPTVKYREIPLSAVVSYSIIWNITETITNANQYHKFSDEMMISRTELLKNPGGEHRDIVENIMAVASYWIDSAYTLFEDLRGGMNKSTASVVMVNKNGLSGSSFAYRLVAAKLGIGTVSFENAILWRLVLDSTTGVSSHQGSEKIAFWRYKDIVDVDIALKEAHEYKEKALSQKWQNNVDKWQTHSSPKSALPQKITERRDNRPLVLFLGHVYSDTSVIYMIADGFDDQVSVLVETATWCMKHGVDFIAKLHPAEKHAFKKSPTYIKLSLDKRWKTALEQKPKDLILDVDQNNMMNTYKLIEEADIVVTVVSGSGFESLIMGKQVINTGAAFYSRLGFTHDAKTPEELQMQLYFALKNKMNQNKTIGKNERLTLSDEKYKEVAKFFYIYKHYVTIDRSDATAAAKKIVSACAPAI